MKCSAALRSGLGVVTAILLASASLARAECVGDCSRDGAVTVDEIVAGIGIALGNTGVDACEPFDGNGDGQVTVDEIVSSVNYALNGCPADCGDCSDHNACTSDSCVDGQCLHGNVVCEDDGNECTAERCDAAAGCGRSNVDDGTSCGSSSGTCQAGICVAFACANNGQCDDGDACTINACIDHACVSVPISCEDDGNECTVDACESASGCVHRNAEDGTPCDDGIGQCQSGVCQSDEVVQYQQNFEALSPSSATALSDDKWLVFGNVFDGAGKYLYGYGSFAAPNGGPAFCAVDTGQGGAEQGAQQFSVYNDYNNQDHAKGYRIEANVFRERRITAADVGTTLTFSFDAKRGNINNAADPLCPCTSAASAFLKTLNPMAGFATTNLVQQNTTDLPTTWTRYSLTLRIDAGLVNQLVQFGFATTATRFQPSGNFYDNIRVSASPTVP